MDMIPVSIDPLVNITASGVLEASRKRALDPYKAPIPLRSMWRICLRDRSTPE